MSKKNPRSRAPDLDKYIKYILAALFNAPTTMGGYFRAEVNHDTPQLAKR